MMHKDVDPHPPVIPSQLSAFLKSEKLRKSQIFHTYDGEGLKWKLKIAYQQKPHDLDRNKLLWEVNLSLFATTNVEELLKTGTIDRKKDERLASMLNAHEPIKFAIRPKLISSDDEHTSLKLAKLAIPEYLKKVENMPLNDFKRKSIYRIIDEGCRFK